MLMQMHGKKGLNGDGRLLRWFLVPLLPKPHIVVSWCTRIELVAYTNAFQLYFGCIYKCTSVVFRLYFGCISVAYTNALQVHFRLRASGPSRSFAFAPAALRLQSKCTPDHPEQTALVRAAQGYLFGGGLSQK